jgi:diguanylate cyclase (GGDEF)-like protein
MKRKRPGNNVQAIECFVKICTPVESWFLERSSKILCGIFIFIREKNRGFIMLPEWVKKLGTVKVLILLTICSSILSFGVSIVLRLLIEGYIVWRAMVFPLAVPIILTPVIGFFFVRLLFELDKTKNQLAVLSMTDELTGLCNRRYFYKEAHRELTRAQRYGQVFSMLFFDLDDFKKINDNYGHPAGDKILCMVGQTCQHESRAVDVLARYGGDEFAILTPGLQEQQAVQFANRLRVILAETKTLYHGQSLQVTVSVGVVTWTSAISDMEGLVYLMDRAMYAAKQGGKNKTRVADLNELQFSFMDREMNGGQ